MNIAERLTETKGRPTGFDYMRIILASSIIVWHGVETSYGAEFELQLWENPIIKIVAGLILPAFFALSGFLVAGSLARTNSLVTFLGLRVLRIVPALAVEVTLSALLLGPVLTVLPLHEYFSDGRFYSYFLNIVGDIHFFLPGLFTHNPLPDYVNYQLWTVPYELKCYIVLAVFAGLGLVSRRAWLLPVIAIVQVIVVWHCLQKPLRIGPVDGSVLLLSFLYAVAIFRFKDALPYSRTLFIAAALLTAGLLSFRIGTYFVALPAAYLTVYVGLLNPHKISLLSKGDYSYGLFLYGFPIQQALASIGPELHHWWLNPLLAWPCALVVAIISWKFIEQPALSLRKHLPAIEARWLDFLERSMFRKVVPIPPRWS